MSVTNSSNRGFTLLEALISLLVFSIGMLGMASLQISASRSTTSAYRISQSTWYAYDMLDRMRANQAGTDNGEYDGIDTADPPSAVDCSGDCTPAEMADVDILEWKTMVETLPSGRGMISRANGQYTITVMWDELGTGATGTDCDPTQPNVDLFCHQVTTEL